MIREKIAKYLIPIVSKHSESDELDGQMSLFDGYGLDSMEFVELMFYIEEEFGIAVNNSSELFERLNTLDKVVAYVEANLKS